MACNKEQLAFFVNNKTKIQGEMKKHSGLSLSQVIDLMMVPVVMNTPDYLTEDGRYYQDINNYPWHLFKEEKKKFISLTSDIEELYPLIQQNKTIFLIKAVQSGKTSEVLKIIEHTYKTSCTILVSTLTSVAGQTNRRATGNGWTTKDFSTIATASDAVDYLRAGEGKKVIAHFLMEHNNLTMLMKVINMLWCPITLIVDEGDKNRTVDVEDDDFDDEMEVVMPPVTRMLQVCKNLIADREDGSKTIYVTATPAGLFCAEKDEERLVIVKEPFKNWRGVAYKHPCNVEIRNVIRPLPSACRAKDRWTCSDKDYRLNTYRDGVRLAVERFNNLDSKDDNIKQVMLISLENWTAPQARMGRFVSSIMSEDIDLVIFNGANKDKNNPLLADRIGACEKKKVIVISGFMAARGVSFTDFSDKHNPFELVAQVHAAKRGDAINSSLQAMRIYGPDRRTVSRPVIFCNHITAEDNSTNFLEYYRICQELAEGQKVIFSRHFNPERAITPAVNRRYMVRGSGEILLMESPNPKDHEPILEM